MRVLWTKRSIRELAAIGDYIAERNPRAATRILHEIRDKTQKLLSANPFIGRIGDIEGTRELVVPGSPYIVAYRVTDDQGEILFVQHGARERPNEI